jgi:16S rRNA (guanine966-N2)-methyltransferase
VVGARVLDAYAGTGALGIEALSRGARSATFIEADRRARSLIAQNVAICRVENVCVIIPAKVGPALETLRAASSHAPFDIVLLDPPYAPGEKLDAVLAAAEGVLARGGIAVLEHARRRQVPEAAGRLRLVREVVAGDAALAFYEVSQHA